MALTPSETSSLCPGCKQTSLEPVTGQMCPRCHTYSGASVARLLHAHTTRLRERLSYLDRVLAAADAMADDLRDGNRTTATQNVAAYDAIRMSRFAPPAAPDAPRHTVLGADGIVRDVDAPPATAAPRSHRCKDDGGDGYECPGCRAAASVTPAWTMQGCPECRGTGKEGTGQPSGEGGEEFRECFRCQGSGFVPFPSAPPATAAWGVHGPARTGIPVAIDTAPSAAPAKCERCGGVGDDHQDVSRVRAGTDRNRRLPRVRRERGGQVSKRIAPTVMLFLDDVPVLTDDLHAELRALLAVARVARRHTHDSLCECSDPVGCAFTDMDRALARLDRVGK